MAITAPLGATSCPTCGTVYDYGVTVCPKDNTSLSSWRPPITGEHDPVVGLKLGDWVVQRRVAHGGMGIVYLATHPQIGRQMAVKVLRPEMAENQTQKDRFVAEAKAISAIRHRGIVDVVSFGQLPDTRNYMIMEYLDGEGLDIVLTREGQLPFNVALPLFDEILDALSAAHSVGVIHRDMKPSNVFLAKQSNGVKTVKLVDFGLAKQTPMGDVNAQAYARASLVAGTPEYISPEQIRGEAPTARTDLYGFAVVAFEALTGKLPFVGQTVVDTLEMHARRPPPHVKVFRPDVPPALDDLIFRMMAKQPADRPSSAEAARQELQRLMREMNIEQSLQPRDAPTSPSLPNVPGITGVTAMRLPSRRSGLLAVGGVLAMSAVAVGAFLLGRAPVSAPAPVVTATVAKVDPPPAPEPAPPVAAPPAEVVAPVPVAAEPGPDDEKDEPRKVKHKGPWAATDRLGDDEWKKKLGERLNREWTLLQRRAEKDNFDTTTAKAALTSARTAVDAAARNPRLRKKAYARVAFFEDSFLKPANIPIPPRN